MAAVVAIPIELSPTLVRLELPPLPAFLTRVSPTNALQNALLVVNPSRNTSASQAPPPPSPMLVLS